MFEYWMETDLMRLPKVHQLPGRVFVADGNAVKVGVKVTDNGEPITLSGTVTASVVKPDGTTATIAGSKYKNTAWVVAPSVSRHGKIGVFLKLTNGNEVATLGGVESYVY